MNKQISICLLPLLLSCQIETQQVDYESLKSSIDSKRIEFQKLYQQADSSGKPEVISKARNYIFDEIRTDIFNAWYGTPWDFDGHTTTPGTGKIACGYFVTTVLKDAGFNIPRVYWAQQASEYFILKMTSDVRRFRNRPVEEVITWLKNNGDGLYIVGLDIHTGFIYKYGDTIRFVHSNYYNPDTGVMAQELDSYNPLNNSSYRIIGKILGDDMMMNWINNTVYKQ